MASQTEEGETVLDLYAGIGYYSLPILVHSKAAHVHACEWNPHALESLRVNLEANGVIERCTIHGGDNRLSNEDICGLADRVLLGLLPSSEEGYKAALDAIKPSGGVLHVHGLGRTRNHEAWADDVESSLLRISNSIGLERSSLVKVKSHSPHWDHLVLDVFIQPA